MTVTSIYNVDYPSRSLILFSEYSPRVLCSSCPYIEGKLRVKEGRE